MLSGILGFAGIVRFAVLSVIVALVALVYIQNRTISAYRVKNSNLKYSFKQCKMQNEAKGFESRWSDEFYEAYRDLKEIGEEDANETTNSTYSTTSF